jgi:hypothetical protein
LPLSLPNGAIPIKEEVCFLEICSISGKNPIIVEDKTLPTPGMLSITLTFWLRSLLFFKRVSISYSIIFSSFSKKSITLFMLFLIFASVK